MTFKEFFKTYMSNGIIPNIPAMQFEWLETYFANQTAMDAKVILDYGSLIMADDDSVNINKVIIATIQQGARYKYPKLYESMLFEYNPIWNYDGTNTTTFSEHITTDANGEKVRTNVLGERNNDLTSHVVPFDSTTESETGKDVNHSASATDTETNAASTDTHTSGTHTVTEVKGGNQGTTTTQAMIREERQIVDFDFIACVLKDVVSAITIPKFDNDRIVKGWFYGL